MAEFDNDGIRVLWLNLIMMAYNEPPKKKKCTLLLSNESYG